MRLGLVGSRSWISKARPICSMQQGRDWTDAWGRMKSVPLEPHVLKLAVVRHSKIADGLPLSGQERSCSGHHHRLARLRQRLGDALGQ
jgi:hypothetical protein